MTDTNAAQRDETPDQRLADQRLVVAETERLVLRRIDHDDLDFFAALFADPEVMRFSMGVRTRDESREWIDRAAASYVANGYGPWCVVRKSDGGAIGFCGLVDQTIDGAAEVEIGYRLAESHWGQGYAPEAAAAVRDLAIGQFGLSRVIALVDPLNVRSIRVVEKIGMDWSMQTLKWHRRLRVYSVDAGV
ncbi:MAG: GNAT family N-acetyltransferase [Pirellulales bacterium]